MVDSVRGDILVFIHSQPSNTVSEQQLIQKFGPDALAVASDMAVQSLLDHDIYNLRFRLQARGRLEVAQYSQALRKRRDEEARQQAARKQEQLEARSHEEKQQRKSFHHDFILLAVELVVGFLLGLLLEYHAHLVEYILRIFGP